MSTVRATTPPGGVPRHHVPRRGQSRMEHGGCARGSSTTSDDRTVHVRHGRLALLRLDGSCDENGGCDVGDPQYEWLAAQLEQRSDRCIVAFWHQPRFSSGSEHGSDEAVAGLWTLLQRAGADLVLNGHEHHYERFVPKTPPGVRRPVHRGDRGRHGWHTHVSVRRTAADLGDASRGARRPRARLARGRLAHAIRHDECPVRSPTELEAIADPPHPVPSGFPFRSCFQALTPRPSSRETGSREGVRRRPSGSGGHGASPSPPSASFAASSSRESSVPTCSSMSAPGSPISRSRSGTVRSATAGRRRRRPVPVQRRRHARRASAGSSTRSRPCDRGRSGCSRGRRRCAPPSTTRSWRRPACAVRSPARMRGPPGACS